MNEPLDILSTADYPLNVLSNFYPNAFVLDGVPCASMEGFLQSLKTRDLRRQREICALSGKTAKRYFRHRPQNVWWKLTGTLHWQGCPLRRGGEAYRQLLDRAYAALAENETFAAALRQTEGHPLIHSIGKTDPRRTVLTEEEFVSRLMRIREKLAARASNTSK